jgi:hypothetical protein
MAALKEIMTGYAAANAWDAEEERVRLPRITIEESVRQYLELLTQTT